MTNQYKKLPVTMKMWMQFNVMARTIIDWKNNDNGRQLVPCHTSDSVGHVLAGMPVEDFGSANVHVQVLTAFAYLCIMFSF